MSTKDTKALERAREILNAYMNEDIDPKLADSIRMWFMSDAHEKEKYAALEELWNNYIAESRNANPKLDADFARIAEMLGFPEMEYKKPQTEGKRRKKLSLRIVLLRAAAVLAPLFVAGAAYLWFGDNRTTQSDITKVTAPAGEHRAVTLPDSTRVKVFEGSEMYHAETFGRERGVKLNGEAHFKVTKADRKRGRFTVRTEHLTVAVLGTEFKVCSFDDAEYSTIDLFHGSVEVEAGGRKLVMSPREHLHYDHATQRVTVETTDLDKIVYDQMPDMVFFDSPITEVFRRLEREYGVRIVIEGDMPETQTNIRGDFSEIKTLDELMGMLQKLSGQFTYRIYDDEIKINTKNIQ